MLAQTVFSPFNPVYNTRADISPVFFCAHTRVRVTPESLIYIYFTYKCGKSFFSPPELPISCTHTFLGCPVSFVLALSPKYASIFFTLLLLLPENSFLTHITFVFMQYKISYVWGKRKVLGKVEFQSCTIFLALLQRQIAIRLPRWIEKLQWLKILIWKFENKTSKFICWN